MEIELAIAGEMNKLVKADAAAQRELWREKSRARREGRRPDPRYARAWVATGDAIAALRAEHGLYKPKAERNEFYFDPALAFATGLPQPSGDDSHFPRHP